LESLQELRDMEMDEDKNIIILRNISLSILSIYEKLEPDEWRFHSICILESLKDSDHIRRQFYESKLDKLNF
jgi:hypothetical protein